MAETRSEHEIASTAFHAREDVKETQKNASNVNHAALGELGTTGAPVARAVPKTVAPVFNRAREAVKVENVKREKLKKSNLAI